MIVASPSRTRVKYLLGHLKSGGRVSLLLKDIPRQLIEKQTSAMFTCQDGKGGEFSSQAS